MKVIVKTNCSENKINYDDSRSCYKVGIKAKPVDGKANVEIEKFLSKHFGKKLKIISGFKSKIKLLKEI
ncbi:DUF167 domain-containing protein [Candidatus Woesearchaeota archaeon]|jgi:uncharacterized protein (TIGR00251 family)|nr:DUF167 domain-containing protein [Candidatus Woesearchaeota archaeon]